MGRGILRKKGIVGRLAVDGASNIEGPHMVLDTGFAGLEQISIAKEVPDSKMAIQVGSPVIMPGQDPAKQHPEQQERKVRLLQQAHAITVEVAVSVWRLPSHVM